VALRLEAEIISLRTKYPFRIARHVHEEVRTVLVKLRDEDGVEGWGEATPQKFYGETPRPCWPPSVPTRARFPRIPFSSRPPSSASASHQQQPARAALSTALHDWWEAARRADIPDGDSAAPRSTFTIGIDTAEMIKKKVREAEQYPILKIKLGSDRDLEILQAIREVTDRELRVDANCGWTVKHTIRMLPVLEEYGVTVLEQPLVREDIEGLGLIRRKARIPLIVDEACITSADIPRLIGKVDGINIKLAKTGSLIEAVRMIHIARAHHLMVMVGCMVETSIAITAAAQFTPLVDIVDLDGAALLAEDPYTGATIHGGQLVLPSGPGSGSTTLTIDN
jgi:L-alanine-DL-glutamate epimerase-like enolase superfamily enzyme